MNEKKGRGRPKKDCRFTDIFEFRATSKHAEMVEKLATKDGKSKGEVLREALEKYYYLKIMDEMTYF